MQIDNRLLDDLTRMASGAAGAVAGVRREVEGQIRQRLEDWLAEMDLVTREEFETVRDMAVEAREEQARLTERLAALEARLADADKPPQT